jgi:hypothetical protein
MNDMHVAKGEFIWRPRPPVVNRGLDIEQLAYMTVTIFCWYPYCVVVLSALNLAAILSPCVLDALILYFL